jgi:hypothetical protein
LGAYAADVVTCAWCGTTSSAETPLGWSSSVERGVLRWYCERCSRDNLRSIEGKLDSDWW